MKLLHTADWHVGKTIRGESRIGEHRAVLADLVRIADAERPDVVLIAGDVYETAAPSPEAEALVLRTILDLRETGARVVVLAGNHDNPRRFDAVRPVFAALDVTVLGEARRPDDGGVIEHAGGGGDVRLALLPFCSQRSIIRSEQLMGLDAGQLAGVYDERVRRIIERLTAGFAADAVNVFGLHGMVSGALLGGGERSAQSYQDYWIGSTAFPPDLHYVAVGHVHRTQQIGGAAPIWYSGSPLQVDFGDIEASCNVLIVEATPSTPAKIRAAPVAGARTLLTLTGTVDELRERAGTTGEAFLRVIVKGSGRVGLAEEMRELLGEGVVEVRIQEREREPRGTRRAERQLTRTPHELFGAYLEDQGIADARLNHLFAELLDLETS